MFLYCEYWRVEQVESMANELAAKGRVPVSGWNIDSSCDISMAAIAWALESTMRCRRALKLSAKVNEILHNAAAYSR
jgi:hypothetical protein